MHTDPYRQRLRSVPKNKPGLRIRGSPGNTHFECEYHPTQSLCTILLHDRSGRVPFQIEIEFVGFRFDGCR